jgi:LmbE family N-acetylglucosaminyl deacetylase
MATILAVSPHLDDAVLSYGGQLVQLCTRGDRVIVYTVFAGLPSPPYSPAAVKYHQLWGLPDDPVRARLQEDQLAMGLLGAAGMYGPFLDGIYRRDGSGGWLVPLEGRSGGDHLSAEPALVAGIAEAVGQLIADIGPSLVVTCSATGDHVDHARARNATVMAAMRTATPIRLWEDLPYGCRTDYIPSLPGDVALASARIEHVDGQAWETKMHAVGCYASQHQMLVYQGHSIAEQLSTHALSRGRFHGDQCYGELAWDIAGPLTNAARTPRETEN